MGTSGRRRLLAALLAALVLALVGSAVAARVANAPPAPRGGKLAGDQEKYLQLAETGVRNINRYWFNSRTAWYNDRLAKGQDGRAPIWTTVHLFSALNGIAEAAPTAANKRAVEWFADNAYRQYWNPQAGHIPHTRRHIGGFNPSMRQSRGPRAHVFFDDNGWLGLAFLEAYQITRVRRYLNYADTAFQLIAQAGWADGVGGGVWWDNRHVSRSSESIASGTALAALLYQTTHRRSYLQTARKFISWADSHIWDASNGLYMRDPNSPILMGYVQSPFMLAFVSLCQTTKDDTLCDKAEQLGNDALTQFTGALHHGPQYDAVYLHWMLEVYAHDHNAAWYKLAVANAQRALANAQNKQGLFLKGWDGSRAPDAPADAMKIDAATVSVFAWLAAAAPPSTAATPGGGASG
ncbi:MAG TPA: glycoside hydrolase family 76 protein [Thermoleophilaceae bacterium]